MIKHACISGILWKLRSGLPQTQDRILAKDPILPTYIKTPAGCVWCVARLSLEWNCIAADMDYFAAFASGRDTFIEIGVNQIYIGPTWRAQKKLYQCPIYFVSQIKSTYWLSYHKYHYLYIYLLYYYSRIEKPKRNNSDPDTRYCWLRFEPFLNQTAVKNWKFLKNVKKP